jgi:hypothetical protein
MVNRPMVISYELYDWRSILDSGRNFIFCIKSRPKLVDQFSFLGNNLTRAWSSPLTAVLEPKKTLLYFPIYLHGAVELNVYAK